MMHTAILAAMAFGLGAASPDPGQQDSDESDLRELYPVVAASFSVSPLYYTYRMESPQGTSEAFSDVLHPRVGAELRLELWPLIWAGVEAQARLGARADYAFGLLDQGSLSLTPAELQTHLRARYVLESIWRGVAVGARFGLRYFKVQASEQSPFTVVPGIDAYLLAPGLELFVPIHPQLLTTSFSAEVVPFGLYGESPDSPGSRSPVPAWGWRVEAAARSTFYHGLYLELHAFAEQLYASYSGTGLRSNMDGELMSDGKVSTGLHGFSLGLGFSH